MNLSTYDRGAVSAPFWKSSTMLHEPASLYEF